MKAILDLTKAIKNNEFYNNQYKIHGLKKNILFVNPQLSGKQLYKYIIPYFNLYNDEVVTSITGVDKFNKDNHLLTDPQDWNLQEREIAWADFIVFPFTTQSLKPIYDFIRQIDQRIGVYTEIIFNIDFNYYELSDLHPFKKHFTNEIIDIIEQNVINSDIMVVTNALLQEYMIDKFQTLYYEKYSDSETFFQIVCMPMICDNEIMLENINNYKIEQPTKVIYNKKAIQLKKTAQLIKRENIKKENKQKNKDNGTIKTKHTTTDHQPEEKYGTTNNEQSKSKRGRPRNTEK